MSSKVDLLVLGATGVSGRQTTRYLAQPHGSSFTLAIAARSRKKLDDLVKEYSLPSTIQTWVVDVTDSQQVEQAVKNAKVVLNTVGPFYRWGTPVVRACAENGVHYVDLTGEPYWVKEIIDEYDQIATKTGAIIVPACGMDSLPSDISVYVANKALKAASALSASPLQIESSITSWHFDGLVSYGSFSTMMTALELVPKSMMNESRRPYYLSPVSGRLPPGPRLLYKLSIPNTLDTHIGGIFVMKNANQAIVERSWGIFEHNASTANVDNTQAYSEAKRLQYGSRMVYDEFATKKSAFAAILASLGMLSMALLAFRPIRWLAKRAGPQEGTGFSNGTLEKGKLKIVNVTKAEGPDIQAVVTLEGKGDPGYLLSPIMMADCALTLLFDASSLSMIARRGGILTPATAFGNVIVERMQKNPRFNWTCEVVRDGKVNGTVVEGRKDV
ncbi:hypothetical protein D9758_006689 [Tetrapyrgos nigripes]|uniref:Saccharopine dehydrogenase NADP binding domain-containing protein n=1 Tax=Tetrapyrgos nigripes TaxID=182062 RepID=A0A8H5GJA4_9AGAR|nr:hypothetical protein D9758_006689 [Tetrapyrgos nigripes]